jgi:hypothetical protein
MPTKVNFRCPTDKKRTKQTTEAMIVVQENLDLFWRKHDANWKRKTKKTTEQNLGITLHDGKVKALPKQRLELSL